MEERMKFRRVHALTGAFVLAALAVLVVALVFTGHSQRWFIGNVTLRIRLPEAGAAGIRQGSEVYFLGTLMGSVSDVSINPNGRMEARVNIRRDFFQFVRADSSAVVKKKFSVVGDAYFEIKRGQGPPLPEKDASISCNEQLSSGLEAAIEEIRLEALPALKKLSVVLDTWTGLGSNLITTRLQLEQFILRADDLVAGVQQGKGTAGKFLTDPSIANELETLLIKSDHSIDDFDKALKYLKNASRNFEAASTNLPSISAALGREAGDISGLAAQTMTTMRELERVVEAMQRHWLLRKYVNLTNPPPLREPPGFEQNEKSPLKPLRSPRASGK